MTSIASDSLIGQPQRYPPGPLPSPPETRRGFLVVLAALGFIVVIAIASLAGHSGSPGATNVDTADVLGKMSVDMSSGAPMLKNASNATIRAPEVMCMDKSTPVKSTYLIINRKFAPGSTSAVDGLNLAGMTQPSCAVIDLTIAQ